MSPRDLGGAGAPCRLGGSGGGRVLAAGFAARDEAAWQSVPVSVTGIGASHPQ